MCSRGYFISLAEEFWLYPETKKATLKKSKCSLNSSNSSCIKFKKKKNMKKKSVCMCGFTKVVEELLESLDLEKSNYHMGVSRVS